MTVKPIIFSGPMVRALLDGRKTQTRRILKPQPTLAGGEWRVPWGKMVRVWQDGRIPGIIPHWLRYEVGDLLYVRESAKRDPDLWTYAADGAEVGWPGRRRMAAYKRDSMPSIHLPRCASRLTIKVTDVRVQRLHNIKQEDAIAEGAFVVPQHDSLNFLDQGPMVYPNPAETWIRMTPRAWFRELWDSINGDKAWDENPWVAAITFEVIKANVDSIAPSGSNREKSRCL